MKCFQKEKKELFIDVAILIATNSELSFNRILKDPELWMLSIRASFLQFLFRFIIKFRYNARSDWLKERALSEYRARSVEKWRTNLCFGILTNLTPIKLRQTKRINTDYMEAIVNNSSVKTVRNLQVMLSFRQTTDENTVIK